MLRALASAAASEQDASGRHGRAEHEEKDDCKHGRQQQGMGFGSLGSLGALCYPSEPAAGTGAHKVQD
jgi:hypothetical protein